MQYFSKVIIDIRFLKPLCIYIRMDGETELGINFDVYVQNSSRASSTCVYISIISVLQCLAIRSSLI